MYGKLFSSTFTGSMVGAGPTVFAVWAFVIANTVKGQCELNPRLLAPVLGTTTDDVQAAIEYLMRADPESRCSDNDGRRLVREGAFAYRVPTHEHYRTIRNEDERREYNRRKKAEQRARERSKSNGMSLTGEDRSALSAHTEAEAEAEADKHSFDPTNAVHAATISANGSAEALELIPPKGKPAKPKPPNCPYQAIVDAYHEALPTGERVVALSETRKAHIAGRWRELWAEEGFTKPEAGVTYFRDFFAKAARSKFLTGQVRPPDGRAPFRVSLPWLMLPENHLKVLEGRYDR